MHIKPRSKEISSTNDNGAEVNIVKPTEIKDIRKETSMRKKKINKFNDQINLNKSDSVDSVVLAHKDNIDVTAQVNEQGYISVAPVPLLDEGTMYDVSSARLYIPRGEIQALVDRIPDDYVGIVNNGHTSYFEDAVNGNIGYWTKEDLKIIDIKGDRKRLMAGIHLNASLNIVQDLKTQGNPLALSVEMMRQIKGFVETDEQSDIPLVHNLELLRIGVVGDGGNASSNLTINLSKKEEESMSELDKKLDKANTEDVADESADDATDAADTSTTEDSAAEDSNTADADDAQESNENENEETDTEAQADESTESTDESTDSEESTDSDNDELATAASVIEKAQKDVAAKGTTLASLIKGNPVAEAELASVSKKADHYEKEFASLSVEYAKLLASTNGYMPSKSNVVASKKTDNAKTEKSESIMASAIYEELNGGSSE